jgi:hypothetical protein
MKFYRIMGGALCVALIGVAAADDAARIQAGMNAYCKAVKSHKNADAVKILGHFFAPDATFTDARGQTKNLDAWEKEIEVSMSSLKSIDSIELKLASFKAVGDAAKGIELFHMQAKMPDPANPKKMATLVVDDKSEVIYKKSGGHWLAFKSKVITDKVTLNGKPMGGM